MNGETEAEQRRHYRLGLALAASGGLCLSFGGLILRHIETADGWQILIVRSLAFSLTLLVFLLLRYRGRIRQPIKGIGRRGLMIVPALGLGFTCYLFGLVLTSVANVVFIVSTSPFFAALLGWLLLRQRVPLATWLAIAVALSGVALMVAGGLGAGGIPGMLVALGAPMAMALLLVTQRRQPQVDMVPAVMLGGLLAGLLAAVIAEDWWISAHDVALAALMGVGQVGFGFILVTLGARWLPPAQTALLALSEAVLAPFWVWLFIGEEPALTTLLGGAMILSAVAGQALWGLSRRPRPASAPRQASG